MKNKMVDVRNHICAMLEEMGEKDCSPAAIERAKATSQLAAVYVSAVKTEIDALRLADEIGQLPKSVTPDDVVLLENAPPKPRLVSNQ